MKNTFQENPANSNELVVYHEQDNEIVCRINKTDFATDEEAEKAAKLLSKSLELLQVLKRVNNLSNQGHIFLGAILKSDIDFLLRSLK